MEEIQQTAEPVNKLNSAAVNGLKLAAISIIFSLIATLVPKGMVAGTFLGLALTLFKLGATITFLWWAMKTFSLKNAAANEFTTYGNVFTYGLLTSVFSGIILAVYSYIDLKWINPDSVQLMKDAYLGQLQNVPEASYTFIENIFSNIDLIATLGTFFSAIFYGLIFSLILAYFTKIDPNRMQSFGNGQY